MLLINLIILTLRFMNQFITTAVDISHYHTISTLDSIYESMLYTNYIHLIIII
jgi:hypothetical protein